MKHGVRFAPDPRIVRTEGAYIAKTVALGPWTHIRTGTLFEALPHGFQRAVLLHEEGHIRLKHVLQRLTIAWRLLTFRATVADLRAESHRQELEADRYAASHGYAHQIVGLARLGLGGGMWHPSANERIENLKEYL